MSVEKKKDEGEGGESEVSDRRPSLMRKFICDKHALRSLKAFRR